MEPNEITVFFRIVHINLLHSNNCALHFNGALTLTRAAAKD